MADTPISGLVAGGAPQSADEFVVSRVPGTAGGNRKVTFADLAAAVAATVESVKGATIELPVDTDGVTVLFTKQAITITQVLSVCKGGSPSCAWELKHGADRTVAGTNIAADTTTSKSTGQTATIADATVPANSFIWIDVGTTSDTQELHISFHYTVD